MEVADEIVIINRGEVEQTGGPAELYETPANHFVMGFLGPVTRLNHALVRPHDLEIFPTREPDSVGATVQRVLRLGFEVRVELVTDGGEPVWAQVTRGECDRMDIEPGVRRFLRPAIGAVTVPA